ncbi:MAG: hypothetical protein BAA02_06755 [Paenibacillaceae bacterium ZCTH02-B3]|nr:MAG: hypothetical protein BAA02_06755 [Paenibacillaceae bacterium ZCTH02-B3]
MGLEMSDRALKIAEVRIRSRSKPTVTRHATEPGTQRRRQYRRGRGIPDAPWHPVVVRTGGGTTSLIVPSVPDDGDGEDGGGESGGGGGSWNPVRLS